MERDEFMIRVEQNKHVMMRIARSMIPERDCEDAVQSAVLSAWEHLPQLRDEQAFDAWLRQILINRCRQMQRGYARERDTCAALCDLQHQDGEAQGVLDEALNSLDVETNRLIRLHHEYGYTIKEISASSGLSEDVVKMRLCRARKRLRIVLISLLILALLAAVAFGCGMLDVDWFMGRRRAEPAALESAVEIKCVEFAYEGKLLDVSVSDAVWDVHALSLSLVYSIAGLNEEVAVVSNTQTGVDGVRCDHIWLEGEILPMTAWAQGRTVWVYEVDGWRLGGRAIPCTEDNVPDGKGQTFLAQLHLNMMDSDTYAGLVDADGMLTFTTELMIWEQQSGKKLEAGTAAVCVSAPAEKEWREAYEAYHR